MAKTYCIFSALYLPNLGGVEKYTQNLARELVRQGDRAIVVTSNVFGLAEIETVDGIEIVRLPCYNVLAGRCPVSKKNANYRHLWAQLIEREVDYVVINTRFYRHSLEGMRFAEAKGIKPVVIDHGSAHLSLGNPVFDAVLAAYEHGITAFVKRHAADYYAVSLSSCDWLNHFGIKAKGTLYNSLDARAFREAASARDFRTELNLPENAFVVSFTGRLVPEKGILPLLDAAEVLANNHNIAFLLAGDGSLRAEIENRALPNVHLLGSIDVADVAALLTASDAFCLPSRSEGFSTSLLECAACGTTPIMTRVGGADELIEPGVCGCILESADAQNIVANIEYLYENPQINNQFGAEIQHRVEANFSWEATTNNVRTACEQAQI